MTTTTTPFILDRAAAAAAHSETQVSARALRTLLRAATVAAEPTADNLPMLHGVHLHTAEHPTTGATTLIGTATDGFLAVQARASARGWWDATLIDAPHVHTLVTVLTDYLAIEDPSPGDDDVLLVRHAGMVTLHLAAIYGATVPISGHEFPMESLQAAIDHQPEGTWRTDTVETLPTRLRQLVELAGQHGRRKLQVIKPNGGPVTHVRIGEAIQAWRMPFTTGSARQAEHRAEVTL